MCIVLNLSETRSLKSIILTWRATYERKFVYSKSIFSVRVLHGYESLVNFFSHMIAFWCNKFVFQIALEIYSVMLVMLCYEFLSRIASSVLKVNCYQWGSCVGGPSAFNSPFGHRSRSHNICPLDNHLSGLSISLSSLVLSWVYRLPFFKSLVWLGCDSNSQPSVLVASTLPLHYQSC